MGDDAAFERLCRELEAWEGASELTMTDVLNLPESLRHLVNWVLRAGHVSVRELATHLGQDEAVTASLLGDLSRKGLVAGLDVAGETRYHVRTRDRRSRGVSSNVWRALE
ncbi:MAG: hypothetical protein DMD91_16735 [Candidatus Rokuibacteriota bacterium]|nr:MAG: hypothetical protein DMD91_16735 [Candidatus Rokubacteria bacterium]